jgi:hypothetical protein
VIGRVNVELKASVSEVSSVSIIEQMFCFLNRFQIQFAWNIMQQATKKEFALSQTYYPSPALWRILNT